MTDTPRTWAELQTIFADGQQSGISAQDLRDGFASLADPVPAGGFGVNPYSEVIYAATYKATGIYDLVHNASGWGPTTVGVYGANAPVGSTVFVRGTEAIRSTTYSLLGSDATNTYGVDIDAGNAFMLSPGVWEYICFLSIDVADGFDWPGTYTFPVGSIIDQASYDPNLSTLDGSVPWIWPGWYNPFSMSTVPGNNFGTGGGKQIAAGSSGQIVNDTDTDQPVAQFSYTAYAWASDVTILQNGVFLRKLVRG